jgi:rare lipoprotein A
MKKVLLFMMIMLCISIFAQTDDTRLMPEKQVEILIMKVRELEKKNGNKKEIKKLIDKAELIMKENNLKGRPMTIAEIDEEIKRATRSESLQAMERNERSLDSVFIIEKQTPKEISVNDGKVKYDDKVHILVGDVSNYGGSLHGSQTATGGRFDQWAMTTAHKTLPFGTKVKVTNKATGKSVVVKVNDRGPYIKGRTFDLSRGAFSKIAPLSQGIIKKANVEVTIVEWGSGSRKENR